MRFLMRHTQGEALNHVKLQLPFRFQMQIDEISLRRLLQSSMFITSRFIGPYKGINSFLFGFPWILLQFRHFKVDILSGKARAEQTE